MRNADLILVMADGRIVGRGSHDELMGRDGLYRQMYLLQTDPTYRLQRSRDRLQQVGAGGM
jgi:ABC-type transport system involved in cytochrome bd biosynthesis fused ATPase/permease subunit